jgi:transcriptional regulator with XRE-family HTH domain
MPTREQHPFVAELVAAMKERKLLDGEVAEAIGVDPVTIRRYRLGESGKQPPAAQLARIRDYLATLPPTRRREREPIPLSARRAADELVVVPTDEVSAAQALHDLVTQAAVRGGAGEVAGLLAKAEQIKACFTHPDAIAYADAWIEKMRQTIDDHSTSRKASRTPPR